MKLALIILVVFCAAIPFGCTEAPREATPTPVVAPMSNTPTVVAIMTVPARQPTQQSTPQAVAKATPKAGTAQPAQSASKTIHVVQSGETLWAIAQKYNTTVDAILAANPDIKDPNLIGTGQEIVIPGG